MMYKIIEQDGGCYRLSLDASHPIYKAHFPGSPITPGVCLLEIVSQLTEQATGREVRLVRAKNIKFLSVLNPTLTSEVIFNLNIKQEQVGIEVQAVIETTLGVVAKMTIYYE